MVFWYQSAIKTNEYYNILKPLLPVQTIHWLHHWETPERQPSVEPIINWSPPLPRQSRSYYIQYTHVSPIILLYERLVYFLSHEASKKADGLFGYNVVSDSSWWNAISITFITTLPSWHHIGYAIILCCCFPNSPPSHIITLSTISIWRVWCNIIISSIYETVGTVSVSNVLLLVL